MSELRRLQRLLDNGDLEEFEKEFREMKTHSEMSDDFMSGRFNKWYNLYKEYKKIIDQKDYKRSRRSPSPKRRSPSPTRRPSARSPSPKRRNPSPGRSRSPTRSYPTHKNVQKSISPTRRTNTRSDFQRSVEKTTKSITYKISDDLYIVVGNNFFFKEMKHELPSARFSMNKYVVHGVSTPAWTIDEDDYLKLVDEGFLTFPPKTYENKKVSDPFIVSYTEKSYAVFGNTFPKKDEFNRLGLTYQGKLSYRGLETPGWIFAKSSDKLPDVKRVLK